MRADADLMVYVAARWPTLAREAVRLGCPPELAADATTDALSRCRRDWARTRREEDVDRLVRDELVAAVRRRPATSPGGREEAARELLVLAPPTLGDLVERARRNRREAMRRRRRPLALTLVAVLGAGVYLTAHDDPGPREPDLPRAVVTRQDNPVAGVLWYAEGRLHLEHVVVAVPGLRDMTRVGAGVVYGDDEGRVVYAGDDGSLALLGHKDPDVPVAATDETGLAAWYDPATARVHLVEVATGNVRLDTEVAGKPRVVAVDGDVVYLVGADGARALLPTGSTSEVPVRPASLLDVRSRIRVFQADPDTVRVVQSAFSAVFKVPGRGAALSPDGEVVSTRGGDGGVLLYSTRSGAQLDGRLGGGAEVLAVAPGVRGAVAYVVRDGEGAQLRTCQLVDLHCQTVDVLGLDSSAVLAR